MSASHTEPARRLLEMQRLLTLLAIEHAAYGRALDPVVKAAYASGGVQRVETVQSAMGLDRLEAVLVGRLRAAGFVGALDTRRASPMPPDVVERFVTTIDRCVRVHSTAASRQEVETDAE